MIEFRLARVGWSAVVGLGLVFLYAVSAPGYMGFNKPTLFERSEFPAVALTGLVGAALTYLVTRDRRVFRVVVMSVSAVAILALLAFV